MATWRTTQCATGPCRLEVNRSYRITAWVWSGGTPGRWVLLGLADAYLVAKPEDLAGIDPKLFVGVVNGKALAIRFRIEYGLVGRVEAQPDTVTLAVGDTYMLTATTYDIHGNIVPASVTWPFTNANVISVNHLGVVTAIAPGQGKAYSMSGWASDSVVVNVVTATSPLPIMPKQGAFVRQENPHAGCPVPAPGQATGFAVPLAWSAPTGVGPIVAYDVSVANVNGTVLLQRVVRGVSTTLLACGQRIDPPNLAGWSWQVRARFDGGKVGPWSRPEAFAFLPADTSSALVMQAPDYGPGAVRVSLSGATDAITSASVQLVSKHRTWTTVTSPPPLTYYRSQQGPLDAYYSVVGPWTNIRAIFDQGAQRFWVRGGTWDPGPPTLPGLVNTLAVAHDYFQAIDVVSDISVVQVVP